MSIEGKPKSRFSMLKDLFSLTLKPERDYFREISKRLFEYKERLAEIDNKYFQDAEFSEPQVIPDKIRHEREELIRKISTYDVQLGREYDRQYLSSRSFFYWFFR